MKVLLPTAFSRFSSSQHAIEHSTMGLYHTTFSRFSSRSSSIAQRISFVPYSILKVLKQALHVLDSFGVLYPIAFSRFSNGLTREELAFKFCTLQHFQGSQTGHLHLPWYCMFCTLLHFQGSQTSTLCAGSIFVFCSLQHSQGSQASN